MMPRAKTFQSLKKRKILKSKAAEVIALERTKSTHEKVYRVYGVKRKKLAHTHNLIRRKTDG